MSSKGSPLLQLPDELLNLILQDVLEEPWEFSFNVDRSDVLLVCRAFHRIGRPFLYRNVILSNVTSFHSFFCVDHRDWEEAHNIELGDPLNLEKRWRDIENVLPRRQIDWCHVQHLTVDLNFSPAMQCTESPEYCLTPLMPRLINSFGDTITLETEKGHRILPNLHILTESTTSQYEDYEVHKSQISFRFEFYGTFSPSIFSIPEFPYASQRMTHSPAMRFPPGLLHDTKVVKMRDLVDLEDFFPLIQIEPPLLSKASMLLTGAEGISDMRPIKVAHISKSVETLVCINEDFGYHMPPEDFLQYLSVALREAVKQFPKLRRVHLPRLDAFHLVKEEKQEWFQRQYMQAVMELKSDGDRNVARLEIHLDQSVEVKYCMV